MRDLQVDERHGAVEPHDGARRRALVEPHLVADAQVHPFDPGEPVLVDEARIQRVQRLRPTAVQAGVAGVDVDGDRRGDQRGKARRQQGALELLGRREQTLDGDLMLATFGGVGIRPGGRVDARDARGQQRPRIVGPPLHRRGAGLPVGEDHGERRRVAVALQIDAVAADPQRVVDLQPVGPPTAAGEVAAGLVVDVRGERRGLPGWQITRLKVVDAQADRVQRRAVDGVARPERVERRG